MNPDEHVSEVEACRETALRLLSRRAHAVAELTHKLQQRSFAPASIARVTDDLCRVGLLDDAEFARSFVREGLRRSRPVGRRRLVNDLRRRGVSAAMAEAAVRDVCAEDGAPGDLERVLHAARRKWDSLRQRDPPDKAARKLYAFLMRRGFNGDLCRQALDTVKAEDDGPPPAEL